MKIASNTWHYRVFDWWFKARKGESYTQYQARYGSYAVPYNLCPYTRAVLIWAPIYFLFTIPRLWYTLSTIFLGSNALAYHVYGMKALKAEGFIVFVMGFVATILGALFGSCYLLELYLKKRRLQKLNEPPKAESSFAIILKEYIKSGHDKICPQITFVDTSKES